MNTGIYTITNLKNNKIYVGKSQTLKARISHHKWLLKNNLHKNKHLQNSYNKYGENNFVFEILEECEKLYLSSFENYWINLLDSTNRQFGYNLTYGTNDESFKHLEETKIKIGNFNLGKKYSKERCLNISKSLKGRVKSKEHLSKIIKSKMIQVDQYDLNNNFIKTWESISEAARVLKICKTNIIQCCKNKRKTASKYKWCYREYMDKLNN